MLAVTSIAAAVPQRAETARPVYSAFSVTASRAPAKVRCGPYTVSRATYVGRATSPDPRLAGTATLRAKLATNGARGDGVLTGVLTIRDRRRKVRMRATVNGVVYRHVSVTGILTGRLMSPNALFLANVTMFFDPRLRFAGVRVGLNSGQNWGVAYSRVPRC